MLLRGCWWFIKGCIPGRSGLRSGAFLVVECRGPWSAVGLVLVVSTVVRASLLEGGAFLRPLGGSWSPHVCT